MSGASDIVLLARVTGSLVVVVALALLASRFARRLPQGRHSGDLRVCERVGLTRETAAVVLESDGRRLLVGVSPSQVTLLADLGPTPDAADAPRPALQAALPGQVLEPLTRHQNDTPGPKALQNVIPAQRRVSEQAVPASEPQRRTAPPALRSTEQDGVRMTTVALSRRSVRELQKRRRPAVPPTQRGTGSVLDPRTWQQGIEALRDLTARRQ
jgi:flagellar biogenesis protein FliO